MPGPPPTRVAAALAAALAAAVAFALAAPAAAPAAADARARPAVAIVSPAPGALRTGRAVTLKLRVRAGRSRPLVTMYGKGRKYRDVSRLLRRTGEGRFQLRLRAGRQLRYGRNSVFVDSRRGGRGGVAEVHFTLARPVRGLLRLKLPRGKLQRPPLAVAVRARGARLRVRLNGHPAGDSLDRGRGGRFSGSLSPKDGLRYGRNRLTVTAFTADGRFQRAHRSFFVRRDRPLADAGRDRVVRAGTAPRLSAAATRAGHDRPVHLRWRIVRAPRGSHPRLLAAGSAHPRLRTDVNGSYRLRLQATGTPTGAAGRRGAAGRVAGPSSADEVELKAIPDVVPEGLPLRTIAQRGGETGIQLGSRFYPIVPEGVVQVLAVDRSTLEPEFERSYSLEQLTLLLPDVRSMTSDELVVLSGGGQGGYRSTYLLQEAIEAIGGVVSEGQVDGVTSVLREGGGGWSVVGVPGIPAGQAHQLIGLAQGPGAAPGAMRGNLQLDSTGEHFAFAWAPEYRPFDTRAGGSATENAISVDGQGPYRSWDLPFPGKTVTNGFQLLWLDADTLAPRLDLTTEFTLAPEESEQLLGLWPLRNALREILADPKPGLIVLNTIGDVETPFYPDRVDGHDGNQIGGNVLARISSLLQELGANPYVFNTFGAKGIGGAGTPGGYSFVGVTGLRRQRGPNAGAELSTRLVPETEARLAGVLQRNRQGLLEPAATGSPAPGGEAAQVQPAVLEVLAREEAGFPSWSQLSPAEQAAQRQLAAAVGLGLDERTTGIRALYWQVPTTNWDRKAAKLENVCNEAGSCSAATAALAAQLADEFEQVQTVLDYFTGGKAGDLSKLFNQVFLDETYGLTAVANEIRKAFKPPENATEGPNSLGIFRGVLGIAGGIGAFVPGGGVISGSASIAAGITQIVESSAAKGNGEAAFDPYGYYTTLATLAGDLKTSTEQTEHGLEHLADLLVGSPGKLERAAKLIETPSRDGGWALPEEVRDQLSGRLRQTMRQFMWLTMMPPVYSTFECVAEDAGGVARHNPEAVLNTMVAYPEWRQRQSPRTFNLYNTYIALANRNHRGWPQLPKQSLTKVLFGEPNYEEASARGLGFLPEYLMAPSSVTGGYSEAREKEKIAEFEELTEEEQENHSGELFNQNVTPSSPGLMHRNMMMLKTGWESLEGLARRQSWSDYTPSCGHAWNNRGSAQLNAWAEP